MSRDLHAYVSARADETPGTDARLRLYERLVGVARDVAEDYEVALDDAEGIEPEPAIPGGVLFSGEPRRTDTLAREETLRSVMEKFAAVWHEDRTMQEPGRMTADRRPGDGNLAGVPFLTVAEVAETMRVSKMTVYRLVHSGELESTKVNRSFRIPGPAVSIYLRNSVHVPQKLH